MLKRLIRIQRRLKNKMKKSHKGLFAFIGGVGVIMFWYGIWEGLKVVPVIGNPLIAMLIGLIMMASTGLLIFQLVGRDPFALEIDDEQDDHLNYAEDRREMAEKYKQTESGHVDDYFS